MEEKHMESLYCLMNIKLLRLASPSMGFINPT